MLDKNNAYFERIINEAPFAQGAVWAYRAWEESLDKGYDEVVMNVSLFAQDVESFIATLRAAGIESFIYTAKSTAAIENMHAFVMLGCMMEGMCEVVRERYGRNRSLESIPGIRFRIN